MVNQDLPRSAIGRHVFLSYPRENASAAAAIRAALEQAGHAVWQDVSTIRGGDLFVDEMTDGIRHAYAVVAVVSAHWSQWTRREVLAAEGRGLLVIPVVVDGSDVPIELVHRSALVLSLDGARRRLRRDDAAELVAAVAKAVTMAMTKATAVEADPGAEAPDPSLASPPAGTLERDVTEVAIRGLVVDYLERVLAQYEVWAQLYTPLSGLGQASSFGADSGGEAHAAMRVHPTWIDTSFVEAFGGEQAEAAASVEQRTFDDLVPAITQMRQLVLLGDPGSGKTTTLWYLVSRWAQQALRDPAEALPVLVRLNQLGPEQNLDDAIRAQLGPLAGHYPRLLAGGRLRLLLDGLNELPPAGRGEHVRQIRELVDRCVRRGRLAVVTCRELDYAGELDLNLKGKLKISPLDPPRIQRFVHAYFADAAVADRLFWQLAGEPAQRYWHDFRRRVGAPAEVFWTGTRLPDGLQWGVANATWEAWLRQRQHPGSLLALTSNPYLLFMVTLIFERASRIPQDRGLLLHEFIDHLLIARERLSPQVASELKRRLGALAFDTIRSAGRGTAFAEAAALAHLRDPDSLYQARAANILGGAGDALRFGHQLLQEYFAATVLVQRLAQQPDVLASLLDHEGDTSGWDETIVFLGGLYPAALGGLSRVVRALADHPVLACRVIVDSGKEESLAAETKADLVARCRARVRRADLPLPARYLVATELGRLGLALPSDAEHLVPLTGGSFDFLPDRRPVPDFLMARTAVTNREYAAFVRAQGYTQASWWADAWPWASRNIVEPAPYYFHRWSHRELSHPDAPVVGVCWYEAQAFCRWKTRVLDPALRREGWCVRLPTEAEWLIAVRGPHGRLYPWGDTEGLLRHRCQFRGSGLPGPAPVGLYPAGTSPEGIEDLFGNVYELVDSDTDAFFRRCRGGSWQDGPDMLDVDAEELVPVGERTRADVGFRYVYAQRLVPAPQRRR